MKQNGDYKVLVFDPNSNRRKKPEVEKLEEFFSDVDYESQLGQLKKKLADNRQTVLLFYLSGDSFEEKLEKGKQILDSYEIPLLFVVQAPNDQKIKQLRSNNSYGFISDDTDPLTAVGVIDSAINHHKLQYAGMEQVEHQFDMALEAAHMGSWSWNMETNQVFWSSHVESLFGLKQGEFDGSFESYLELIHPEDVEMLKEKLQEVLSNDDNNLEVEHRVVMGDGSVRWLEGKGSRDGQWMRGVVSDITDRKRIASELRLLAESFSSQTGKDLFDNVCQHLTESLNIDYSFVGEVLPGKEKVKIHSIFGEGSLMEPTEYDLEGTPCANIVEKSACTYQSGVQELFPEDEILQEMSIQGYMGIPLTTSGGEELGLLVLLSKEPMKHLTRNRQYLRIYSDRVASEMERLRAEAELRKQEQQLRSINEHISEGIYRSTPEDGLVYVNEAFAGLFGYENAEELLDIDGVKLYADNKRRAELTEIENQQGFIKNEEVEFLRKDGSTFWGLMSGQAVYDEEGAIRYYDGSVLDITERKYAIEENNKLMEAIREIPEAILITNTEGRIEYVNPQFLEEHNSTEEELLDSIAPILKKNKKTASFYDELWETIESGKMWNQVIKSEDSQSWEEVTISPSFGGDGEIANYIIICKDITDRKVHENKLQQSLSEKEVLLAEIHHRVKNNLAIISGLLELSTHKLAGNERARSVFQESQLRIQSMAMIHEKLYQAGNFSNLKIGTYISELVGYIQQTYKKDGIEISVEDEVDIELSINQAIPCALLLNELITNAFKYAFNDREEGNLSIRLTKDDDDIHLTIRDDGPGLPDNFEEMAQESLGFELIRQLTKQLDGELTTENDNGAFIELVFRKYVERGSSSAGYIIDRREGGVKKEQDSGPANY